MVLRSGIIIPFQFRDNKKLLTIGVPEENRDLSIWDLKNVVRSAFGIYNFEFRNKKIGFNIPDDLLLNYLAQRHDLTNFVIEVVQAFEDHATENGNDEGEKHKLSYEPTCSQMLPAALPQKSSESSNDEATAQNLTLPSQKPSSDLYTESHTLNNPSSGRNTPQKIRITQVYSKHTMPETLTQSIDPMDIIPKSEQDESESMMRHPRYDGGDRILQQQQQQQQFLQICGRNMHSPGIQQFAQGNISNRFRRRGERMSKDQKELYVKYFEENPCMLTQRRGDITLEPHWHKLCNLLNAVPQGAMKNVEEWKQTFDAWRYRVFMYTRYNSRLSGPAAQNPKNYKPLTPTDQRAYAMWTSHRNTTPQDFEKMDVFAQLDDTNAEFDY